MRNHSGPVLCGVVHKDVRRRSCIYTMLLDEILPVNGKTLHSCSFVVPLFEPIYLFLLHRRNSTAKVRTRKIYISLSFLFCFVFSYYVVLFIYLCFLIDPHFEPYSTHYSKKIYAWFCRIFVENSHFPRKSFHWFTVNTTIVVCFLFFFFLIPSSRIITKSRSSVVNL